MHFKVTGTNRQTGARMMLEVEAESRAGAERRAIQSGMNVLKVQDDAEAAIGRPQRPERKVEVIKPRKLQLGKLVAVLIVLGVLAYLIWRPLMNLLHR